ncbi:unnamed protein product, partial [Rotaria sp. Silwood2]
MSASDEGRAIAKEYLDFKQKELNQTDDTEVAFGTLLYEMGEWRKSGTYFENLLHHRPNDSQIYFGIGRSYNASSEFDQALSYFKRAYNLSMSNANKNTAFTAKICCSTLRAYHDSGNFDQALALGDEALGLYRHLDEHAHAVGIAQVLINIGLVHFDKAYTLKNRGEVLFALGDLIGALELFEKALEMYSRIFREDKNHRDIAKCQHLIGMTHLAIGNYNKAVEALDTA